MKKIKKMNENKGSTIYAMGFLGALIFYIQQATTFTDGLLGLLKAIFWPAFLIHKLLSFLN